LNPDSKKCRSRDLPRKGAFSLELEASGTYAFRIAEAAVAAALLLFSIPEGKGFERLRKEDS
jgi:hypothetical protein